MAHISELKKQTVKRLQDLISQYDIIGAVNMENLPAAQLQKMRTQLRGKIELFMTKRRLMKVAIEQAKDKKPGIEKIEEYLKGMPALIFTKENPFSLFKTLKKSKSQAPAKGGQTAPKDIEVKAGSTGFAPGPVISELGSVGIKCGVEDGKVAIKEDSVVVKEGEVISQKLAEILTRLGIEPMEVGLNITGVYEKGVIYTTSVLDVDEEEFMNKIQSAAANSLNLSVFISYPTKDNVELLIQKAFNDAKTIGLEQNIIDEGIIDELLGKAERSMQGLKSTANIEVPDKPKEAPKEDIKKEVPKEAPKETPKEEPSTPKETPIEKKEEAVLEKEKEIIKEEVKLEKKESPKIEAPIEKEVKEVVKVVEEKKLENERIDTEKELEKIDVPETTENKVAEMVDKIKKKATGPNPTAENIIEEIKKEEPKKEEPKDDTPSAHDLAQKKKQEQHKATEELTKELLKKGTLRK